VAGKWNLKEVMVHRKRYRRKEQDTKKTRKEIRKNIEVEYI
jgi:hypothetical protein